MKKPILSITFTAFLFWALFTVLTMTGCEHSDSDNLSVVTSKDYSIHFDKNDDSAGGIVPSPLSGVYGEATLGFPDGSSMTAPSSKPFFVGWTSNRDGTGFQVTGGSTFSIDSEYSSSISGGVLVFYAQWSTLPPSGYRILFKNLGGSPEDFTPYDLSYTDLTLGFTTAPFPGQGSELTSPDPSLPYLQSWNTKADGSGKSVILGDTYTLDFNDAEEGKDIVFYAIWGSNKVQGIKPEHLVSNLYSSTSGVTSVVSSPKKGKYNVYFQRKGNTGRPPFSYDDQIFLANGTAVPIPDHGPDMPLGPSGEKYFLGWTLAYDGTSTPLYNKDGAHNEYIVNYADAEGYNIFLYAQWSSTPVSKTYTIIFDKNGGGGNAPDNLGPYTEGATSDAFPAQDSMAPPAGKVDLANWNTKADGSGTSVAIGATYTVASSDATGDTITFYAQWRDNNVTIVFDIDGGKHKTTNATDNPADITGVIGKPQDLALTTDYQKEVTIGGKQMTAIGSGWAVVDPKGPTTTLPGTITTPSSKYTPKTEHVGADGRIHIKIIYSSGWVVLTTGGGVVAYSTEYDFRYSTIRDQIKEVIAVPNNMLPQDSNDLFSGMKNLQKIPKNLDTSGVTNMSTMFKFCHNFNQNISSWDVSNVTNMYAMFLQCHNFNQPLNWDVSNVTNMNRMLNSCYKFNQSLNWDVSKVTNMNRMFGGCYKFNQPLNWNVSNVTNMYAMFYECREFSQDISDWDIKKVSDYDYFAYNTSLTEDQVPAAFDWDLATSEQP